MQPFDPIDFNEEIPEVYLRYATEDISISPDILGNSYASGNIGVGTALMPTGSATERVRGWLFRYVYENWLPFTEKFYGRFVGPRAPTKSFESPYDLDARSAETRTGPYPSGERPFPYPWATGVVSGFMIMLDAYSMAWAWGKTPSGPGILTPVSVAFDAQFPTLPKVSG